MKIRLQVMISESSYIFLRELTSKIGAKNYSQTIDKIIREYISVLRKYRKLEQDYEEILKNYQYIKAKSEEIK